MMCAGTCCCSYVQLPTGRQQDSFLVMREDTVRCSSARLQLESAAAVHVDRQQALSLRELHSEGGIALHVGGCQPRLPLVKRVYMVCSKCEKKLSKVICPDKWKEGANNTTEGGGRKVNENKLLSKGKRWQPYAAKCKVCKSALHQQAIYCQGCAYSKGVCAMCGKQVLDTTSYKQSHA